MMISLCWMAVFLLVSTYFFEHSFKKISVTFSHTLLLVLDSAVTALEEVSRGNQIFPYRGPEETKLSSLKGQN